MKRRLLSGLALTVAMGFALTPKPMAQTIQIDGSSTVFPLTEAVGIEYRKAKGEAAQFSVAFSGTSGGFRKFCRGETAISNASRPISRQEMATCKAAGIDYIELPVAYDALSIAVNPANTMLECISVAELRRLWQPGAQGTITRWRQLNSAWPNVPIALYGAGGDSGTFDFFTEVVVGKARSQRTDYADSEDDDVIVRGIANDPHSLGYLPFAYVAKNRERLKVLKVSYTTPECVEPTEANVLSGRYRPLSRVLFMYVSKKEAQKVEIKDFVEFFLSHAGTAAHNVAYVPLSDDAYARARDRFRAGKAGTAFDGAPGDGLRLKDLFKREPQT